MNDAAVVAAPSLGGDREGALVPWAEVAYPVLPVPLDLPVVAAAAYPVRVELACPGLEGAACPDLAGAACSDLAAVECPGLAGVACPGPDEVAFLARGVAYLRDNSGKCQGRVMYADHLLLLRTNLCSQK